MRTLQLGYRHKAPRSLGHVSIRSLGKWRRPEATLWPERWPSNTSLGAENPRSALALFLHYGSGTFCMDMQIFSSKNAKGKGPSEGLCRSMRSVDGRGGGRLSGHHALHVPNMHVPAVWVTASENTICYSMVTQAVLDFPLAMLCHMKPLLGYLARFHDPSKTHGEDSVVRVEAMPRYRLDLLIISC